MKLIFKLMLLIAVCSISSNMAFPQQVWPTCPIGPEPFTSVHVHDNFRAPHIRTNHKILISIQVIKLQPNNALKNN